MTSFDSLATAASYSFRMSFTVGRPCALRGSGSSVPFIMITAENMTENVLEAKNAGVTAYITKPFNAQILRARIEAIFADA